MIKIEGGTPRSDFNLCRDCSNYIRIKDNTGNLIVQCRETGMRLRNPIVECTKYDEIDVTPMFARTAWIYKKPWNHRTGECAKESTFVPPEG